MRADPRLYLLSMEQLKPGVDEKLNNAIEALTTLMRDGVHPKSNHPNSYRSNYKDVVRALTKVPIATTKLRSKINELSPDGVGVLHCASEQDDYNTICELVERFGANVNLKTRTGVTAIMIAIARGANKKNANAIIAYLLSKGAKVDAKDGNGFTQLEIASDYKNIYAIDILERNGANLNHSSNIKGLTALQIAKIRGCNERVIAILSGERRGYMFKNLKLRIYKLLKFIISGIHNRI